MLVVGGASTGQQGDEALAVEGGERWSSQLSTHSRDGAAALTADADSRPTGRQGTTQPADVRVAGDVEEQVVAAFAVGPVVAAVVDDVLGSETVTWRTVPLLHTPVTSAPMLTASCASAGALLFCGRRLGADRVGMVVAAHDGAAAAFEAPGLAELALTGLDAEASRALLAGRLGGDPAEEVAQRLMVP